MSKSDITYLRSRRGGRLKARNIQSELAEVRADGDDDPLGCLLSDSESPDEGVRQGE